MKKTTTAETPLTNETPTGDIHIDHLPIADIIVGKRFREHYGDIKGLADSIEKDTLQNPIVVVSAPDVPGKYLLVSGGRRIKAFERLKRSTIPAVVKTLPNPMVAEVIENTQREPFNALEKLVIAEALIRSIGERRGAPPKGGKKDIPVGGEAAAAGAVPTLAHFFRHGEKTRDYAARISGLGCHGTLNNVRAVRDNAIEDVKDALRKNAISINCAYEISQQPPKQQLSCLTDALSDIAADRKKLNELTAARRKEKRQKRAGMNPTVKDISPDVLPIEEDLYALIRVAPDFRNTKIETMTDFPIHKHGDHSIGTLVCIECPDPLLDKAFELQRAWGLVYHCTIRVELANGSRIKGLSYTRDKPLHIVVCGFRKLPNAVFADVKTLTAFTCANPDDYARGVMREVFGPYCAGRMLDISSHEPRDGWTICESNYSYGLF